MISIHFRAIVMILSQSAASGLVLAQAVSQSGCPAVLDLVHAEVQDPQRAVGAQAPAQLQCAVVRKRAAEIPSEHEHAERAIFANRPSQRCHARIANPIAAEPQPLNGRAGFQPIRQRRRTLIPKPRIVFPPRSAFEDGDTRSDKFVCEIIGT